MEYSQVYKCLESGLALKFSEDTNLGNRVCCYTVCYLVQTLDLTTKFNTAEKL